MSDLIVPAGTVMAFGGDTAKITETGRWLPCNGTTYDQNIYPDLFAVVQYMYGGDPASGKFAVPDYTGCFLRGADQGSGNDPDAATRTFVGTAPTGATQTGPGTYQLAATGQPKNGTAMSVSVANMVIDTFISWGWAGSDTPKVQDNSSLSVTLNGWDGDSRPVNVYVNYLIKATNS